MAKSRLKTLSELRRVRVDTQIVTVHRCGKWVKLSGTDLLPGDVVSIGRSSGQNGEDKTMPLVGAPALPEPVTTGSEGHQFVVGQQMRAVANPCSMVKPSFFIFFNMLNARCHK
ncbi:CATION-TRANSPORTING ATPASE [Salix purpurea]|uniref:CATION-TRANSPORTING ATPASE n=1 Tax=Salix purpurea TaxID=77065 RepID=A0A9Q0ZS40_SALPP|nr:CATION-TRANSPORTING ATPASE [Salix purpurea]